MQLYAPKEDLAWSQASFSLQFEIYSNPLPVDALSGLLERSVSLSQLMPTSPPIRRPARMPEFDEEDAPQQKRARNAFHVEIANPYCPALPFTRQVDPGTL